LSPVESGECPIEIGKCPIESGKCPIKLGVCPINSENCPIALKIYLEVERFDLKKLYFLRRLPYYFSIQKNKKPTSRIKS
jgi:hypothetical protein